MADELPAKPPTLWEIVTAFTTIGLTGIGGSGAPFRHVLVVQRRWVTERAMAELYGLGQALPGSVIGSFAVDVSPMWWCVIAAAVGALLV
jgi:chromate transport protein ChrA